MRENLSQPAVCALEAGLEAPAYVIDFLAAFGVFGGQCLNNFR
jgi:hypothetical protein